MTIQSFVELTNQVQLLNDLILSDMIYAKGDYAEEFLAFSRHLYATKFWFQRTSWANKRRYILALIEDLKSMWALSMLLKALWNCRPKDAILSASNPHCLTSYDQTPIDHNRTAVPLKTLGQIMINDRKWFYGLEPEPQTIVLSELLIIAGGPIMWEVLRRGQTIYERQRDHQLHNLLECVVVVAEPPHVPQTQTLTADRKQSLSDKSRLTQKSTTGSPGHVSKNTLSSENAQRELDTSLAAWNAIIKSIRDDQKLEELEMIFKDGSKKKIWKVNRPKPEVTETVDFIQLLPSSVGKRIFSFLPRATIGDYARVNRYWAFLIEELKAEIAMRQKLDSELQKFTDLMLKHDVSLEVLSPISQMPIPSMAASGSVTTRGGRIPLTSWGGSVRASERSPGGLSFRHCVVERLKPHKIKPRPIQKMADLDEKLKRRGAADENLWQWCENVIKFTNDPQLEKKKDIEGMINFDGMLFPCPLMRHSLEVPLRQPLNRDPAQSTKGLRGRKRIVSCSYMLPRESSLKRFNLWSRDFSSLYKVFKVASYQYPSLIQPSTKNPNQLDILGNLPHSS